MSNSIKYNLSTESQALKKGNFYIGVNDITKGPTLTTGYFDALTPGSGEYIIYYNKSGSNRIYYCTNGDQVYLITNRLKGQNLTTLESALAYIATQSDMVCTNMNYESIVTDGLILNLDAGFIPSYPKTGTVWYDISGGGNNATMYNGLTYNSGGWMEFDGSNDYCQINYNGSNMSSWSTGQTISIWMYHNITSGRRNPWNQAYGGYGTWTHEQGGSINYYYGNAGSNNNPYTALGSASVPTNAWTHMCVTRTTSSITWYRNGVSTGTHSNPYGTLTSTTSNITIGYGYTGVYWQGRMAIIQSYNRGLSSSEVLQNYNAQKGRFGL